MTAHPAPEPVSERLTEEERRSLLRHLRDARLLDEVDAVVRRILAGRKRAWMAEALRDVDTDLMAEAWGGAAAWFTTGTKVAGVVRDWLDGDAADIEAGEPS